MELAPAPAAAAFGDVVGGSGERQQGDSLNLDNLHRNASRRVEASDLTLSCDFAPCLVGAVTLPADSRTEIARLLYMYAERIDAGDFAGVGALFADGEIRSGDQPRGIRGADAVRGLYAATVRLHADGTPRTKHVTSNVLVDVDEGAGTATARSYFTVLQQLDDFPLQVIVAGRYHDDFVRVDGTWRFAVRRMHVDLQGDLTHHLLVALPRPAR